MKYLHLTDIERSIADQVYSNLTMHQKKAHPAIQALGFDIGSKIWQEAELQVNHRCEN